MTSETREGGPAGPGEGRRIALSGTVQGVGFRPFVWRIAHETGVAGRVRNDAGGVTIEAFGPAAALDRFVARLRAEPPPAAVIVRLVEERIAPEAVHGFEIVESAAASERRAAIPPDLATCEACRREVLDPADRRHRYPFTNCTSCGPRFTIALGAPYDRPATTMARFAMCAACAHEYGDPRDRRFHAQPNACPECGPQVWLVESPPHPDPLPLRGRGSDSPGSGRDSPSAPDPVPLRGRGRTSTGGNSTGENSPSPPAERGERAGVRGDAPDAISLLGAALAAGRVAAVKGIGGFHLACDATSSAAVRTLRERKRREEKPLAVMVADLAAAGAVADLPPAEAALLASVERPIVLCRRRDDSGLAPEIAPGSPLVGLCSRSRRRR